ncbi:MAG: cell division protein ZapD [Burkholderiales bacterium]|nr:cell division protein ZapD [Burkholderiales bacterium]
MIVYEFPLNERVRTLLRIESLYQRARYFRSRDGAHEHHVAILSLFEILDVAGRADLKSELTQELERKKSQLDTLKNNPSVEQSKLAAIITETEQAIAGLLASSGKTGQELRENEWLMAIRQRTAIPGGVCEFDLPSYHHWMHLPAEIRRRDLEHWLSPFEPMRAGVDLILRLLRESGKTTQQCAEKGKFQQMLAGRLAQMLRLQLEDRYGCVPEVSANKYAINIRFATFGESQRKTSEENINFDLTFCNL